MTKSFKSRRRVLQKRMRGRHLRVSDERKSLQIELICHYWSRKVVVSLMPFRRGSIFNFFNIIDVLAGILDAATQCSHS